MFRKSLKIVVIIIPLLFFSYCQRESEAKVHLKNIGNVDLGVKIHYYTYRINAGKENTLTLTWPGRGVMEVNMFVFAIGYDELFDNYRLVLNHKDYIEKEIGYIVQQ